MGAIWEAEHVFSLPFLEPEAEPRLVKEPNRADLIDRERGAAWQNVRLSSRSMVE